MTQKASERGRSAIVVKTAPRRIFVIELDSWHVGVRGCVRRLEAVKRSKDWCSRGAPRCARNKDWHASNDGLSLWLRMFELMERCTPASARATSSDARTRSQCAQHESLPAARHPSHFAAKKLDFVNADDNGHGVHRQRLNFNEPKLQNDAPVVQRSTGKPFLHQLNRAKPLPKGLGMGGFVPPLGSALSRHGPSTSGSFLAFRPPGKRFERG